MRFKEAARLEDQPAPIPDHLSSPECLSSLRSAFLEATQGLLPDRLPTAEGCTLSGLSASEDAIAAQAWSLGFTGPARTPDASTCHVPLELAATPSAGSVENICLDSEEASPNPYSRQEKAASPLLPEDFSEEPVIELDCSMVKETIVALGDEKVIQPDGSMAEVASRSSGLENVMELDGSIMQMLQEPREPNECETAELDDLLLEETSRPVAQTSVLSNQSNDPTVPVSHQTSVGTVAAECSETAVPPSMAGELASEALRRQCSEQVDQQAETSLATLERAFEHRFADINRQLENTKQQWVQSLDSERKERQLLSFRFEVMEKKKSEQPELTEDETLCTDDALMSLHSSVKRLDNALAKLYPRMKDTDDALTSLRCSVELHDGAIARLSPLMNRSFEDGLAALRGEFDGQLKELKLTLVELEQTSAVADQKPQSLDKITALVETETSKLFESFQAALENNMAPVLSKQADLERHIFDLSSSWKQQEGWAQREGEAFKQDFLALRQQFEEHRAISERVEVVAAEALSATQRELNKHSLVFESTQQELEKHSVALVSLAEFTDSAVKDVNSKCDNLVPMQSGGRVEGQHEELTLRIESEVLSLRKLQNEQQFSLDASRRQVSQLQQQIAGQPGRSGEVAQPRLQELLENSHRQLEVLQRLMERGFLRLQHSQLLTPSTELSPSCSQFLTLDERSPEASLGDIHGRVATQQLVQERMERDIANLRGALHISMASQAAVVESGLEAFAHAGSVFQSGLQELRGEVETLQLAEHEGSHLDTLTKVEKIVNRIANLEQLLVEKFAVVLPSCQPSDSDAVGA